MDLILRPDWVRELLEMCVDVTISFAQAQVEAGADIIGLGAAIASQNSPTIYLEFALPYEQQIFAVGHETGALTRLHICGNSNQIIGEMVASGAGIIDLDWMVDMAKAAAVYGEDVSFCCNFDPVAVVLQGTPEKVLNATTTCLCLGGPRAFSGAGCEIPDGTPHDNLFAQARSLREVYDG